LSEQSLCRSSSSAPSRWSSSRVRLEVPLRFSKGEEELSAYAWRCSCRPSEQSLCRSSSSAPFRWSSSRVRLEVPLRFSEGEEELSAYAWRCSCRPGSWAVRIGRPRSWAMRISWDIANLRIDVIDGIPELGSFGFVPYREARLL
jgi:hypothetical protein